MTHDSGDRKWYDSKGFLIAAIVVVGPLALPLVWINRSISVKAKIIVTLALVFLTWAFYRTTLSLTEQLAELGISI